MTSTTNYDHVCQFVNSSIVIRNCAGFFRLGFHDDLDRNGDFAVQADRHLVFPDRLDGLFQLDLALVDIDLVRDQKIRDIQGGDGAIKRSAFSRLSPDCHREFDNLPGQKGRRLPCRGDRAAPGQTFSISQS